MLAEVCIAADRHQIGVSSRTNAPLRYRSILNGPAFGVGLGEGAVEGAPEGDPADGPALPDGRIAIEPDADGDPPTATAWLAWPGVAVRAGAGPSAVPTRLIVPYRDAAARAITARAIANDPNRRVRLVRGRVYMIATVPAD